MYHLQVMIRLGSTTADMKWLVKICSSQHPYKTFDKFQSCSLSPPGFPVQTSCPVIGGPILGWSHTSALCVRRSLPAVTTCRNTSKSTAFPETAGQSVPLPNEPVLIKTRPWTKPRTWETKLCACMHVGVLCFCEGLHTAQCLRADQRGDWWKQNTASHKTQWILPHPYIYSVLS